MKMMFMMRKPPPPMTICDDSSTESNSIDDAIKAEAAVALGLGKRACACDSTRNVCVCGWVGG